MKLFSGSSRLDCRTWRGFQANARIATTADEMLNELLQF
jgi:hypothetical protein